MTTKNFFRYRCFGTVGSGYALSNLWRLPLIVGVCMEMSDEDEEHDYVEINVFSEYKTLHNVLTNAGCSHVELFHCKETNIEDEVERLGLSYLEIL